MSFNPEWISKYKSHRTGHMGRPVKQWKELVFNIITGFDKLHIGKEDDDDNDNDDKKFT
jgi:hypothetical protein